MNARPDKLREKRLIVLLILLLGVLCAANLWFGSVQIPASAVWDILCGRECEKEVWRFIVLESRLPQMIAALLSGAALAVAGLLLQTAFNNPLAGPSILGIDTGASLGVALVMLFCGGSLGLTGSTTLTGFTAIIAGAFAGSIVVLGTILFFSTLVKNNIMLLIVGIMVGYITSSVISPKVMSVERDICSMYFLPLTLPNSDTRAALCSSLESERDPPSNAPTPDES